MATEVRAEPVLEPPRDHGGFGLEVRIRPSERERFRAASAVARTLGVLCLPVGVILALLARDPVWIVVVEAWPLIAGVTSYFGQGHNAVFVGDHGIRRISRGCAVIAPWSDLTRIEVSIPGNRIVVFKIDSSSLEIQKLTRGRSRAARAMIKNSPSGFELRLDRASADALVGQIASRRPGLEGLSTWPTASRLAKDEAGPTGPSAPADPR